MSTVDAGHGRIEWRGIQVKEVTPEQMGFPHVLQLARIDRIREIKGGKQERPKGVTHSQFSPLLYPLALLGST